MSRYIVRIISKYEVLRFGIILKCVVIYRNNLKLWGLKCRNNLEIWRLYCPYKEKLVIFSKEYAYTSDDLKLLQEVTKAEGMAYIPLLQSFGHVEFILKKKEYLHLREATVKELESLGPSIIPMVWSYGDDLTGKFPNGMWQRYSDVFDEIWIASSYKGSSGPCADMVPIQHHINNHLSWLALVDNFHNDISCKIKGISLTGWSRYDHYATLCELLPVSAPCLDFIL